VRGRSGRRRNRSGGAYEFGRLAVFALVIIVLVVILLQLID